MELLIEEKVEIPEGEEKTISIDKHIESRLEMTILKILWTAKTYSSYAIGIVHEGSSVDEQLLLLNRGGYNS